MCILYLTIDLVNQQTWYGTHHQLLVSWISRIRFRISRLKSVTGRYGSLGHLAGHSFLGISFMNGAWSRKSRPGNVTLSLDWLKRFLLGNRTVTYLFDRSALVHRGIVTEQIWYPKGNLVYGAKKGISKREMSDKKTQLTYQSCYTSCSKHSLEIFHLHFATSCSWKCFRLSRKVFWALRTLRRMIYDNNF